MTVASGTAEIRHLHRRPPAKNRSTSSTQLEHAHHARPRPSRRIRVNRLQDDILTRPGDREQKEHPGDTVRLVSLDERNGTILDELERHLPHEPSPPDRPSEHDPSRNAPRPGPAAVLDPTGDLRAATRLRPRDRPTCKINEPFHDY